LPLYLVGRHEQGGGESVGLVFDLFDAPDLFIRAYRSFRQAVHLPREWESAAEFRRWLVHVSAVDQGSDPRDELVTIWSLCNRARERGIDVDPVLREVADLSSEADLHGFGSMQMLIMRGLEEHDLA
jgi:hypothetical protein